MERPSERILRRLRRALRDLDSDATSSDAERLDLLNQVSYEIAQRIATLEPSSDAPGGPVTVFSGTRI